jgi:hypothetical protein
MNKPVQDVKWKQQTPIDQMQVILMSLEGTNHNGREGIIGMHEAFSTISKLHEQLVQLIPFLNDPTLWEPFYGTIKPLKETMSIPRFNLVTSDQGLRGEVTEMVEHQFGKYVLFEDAYEVVEKLKDKLKKENLK